MKPAVHFFGGQGIGWALDEDLLRARESVAGRIREGSFGGSQIVHSAWWPPLLRAGASALRGKSVLCFADNPPAFYLTRPGFEQAASRVDLWVPRSAEAVGQFRELELPVVFAPYAVDPKIFLPLPGDERRRIRRELGIGEGDFVIGNFHRDSLERDVSLPKAQKGPDIFAEIAEAARRRIPSLKVLLAGPRRHWLRGELGRRCVPFVFFGKQTDGDDFLVNVLPRPELNRLYAAMDCTVISSRWEGGPYSALESLLAGTPAISTPVGMAADLLGGWLYTTPEEASALLERVAAGTDKFPALRQAALETHSREALGTALLAAYERFPSGTASLAQAARSLAALGLSRFRRCPLGQHDGVAKIVAGVRQGNAQGLHVAVKAIAITEAESL